MMRWVRVPPTADSELASGRVTPVLFRPRTLPVLSILLARTPPTPPAPLFQAVEADVDVELLPVESGQRNSPRGVKIGGPTPAASSPSLMFGLPIGYLALAALVFQNSSAIIVLRLARTVPGVVAISST